MCEIVDVANNGVTNFPYVIGRNYIAMDTFFDIEIDAPYCVECWGNGVWVKFRPGVNVRVDEDCIFRIVKFTVDFPVAPVPLYPNDILHQRR